MAVSVQQFRADFPEFSSTSMFPSSGIQFWLNFAYRMINASRFMNETDLGAELFTAHFVSLESRNALESKGGGIPGSTVGGPVANKSVDKVSISYDTGAGTEIGAGHWNLTNYGIRFRYMTNLFGAGPIQVGAYGGDIGTIAWSGPDVTPGFSNFS